MGVEIMRAMAETMWSVLLETPLVDTDEPGEAEVELLHALEMLGAEAPVTGGGFENLIAARFCVRGEFWESAQRASTIFADALAKAGLNAAPTPVVFEIIPAAMLAQVYGLSALL